MSGDPKFLPGELKLLPCPFCGGEAGFESCAAGHSVDLQAGTWSVGCMNSKVDCIGYQMLAHFARKIEAAAAWNKRAPRPRTTHYTRWEGGDWHPFVEGEGGRLFGPSGTIHSLRFADGSEWDTVNGWRPNRHVTGDV